MRVALFDLDGTILRGNSWHAYFSWVVRSRPWFAATLLPWVGLRRLRLISGATLRRAALLPLRGADRDVISVVGEEIAFTRLRGLVRDAARREIDRCRTRNYTIALATAAFDFLAEPIAKELGISEIACTRLDYQSGRFTGRIVGEELRGDAKAEAVRALLAGRGIDWRESCAFSDDPEDAPLFSLVGTSTLVTSLRRERGRRLAGVRVVDWDLDNASGDRMTPES